MERTKEEVRNVKMSSRAAYRLAVYDPCEPDDSPEFVGPVFGETEFDKFIMRGAIRRFNKLVARKNLTYCMAPFPWLA